MSHSKTWLSWFLMLPESCWCWSSSSWRIRNILGMLAHMPGAPVTSAGRLLSNTLTCWEETGPAQLVESLPASRSLSLTWLTQSTVGSYQISANRGSGLNILSLIENCGDCSVWVSPVLPCVAGPRQGCLVSAGCSWEGNARPSNTTCSPLSQQLHFPHQELRNFANCQILQIIV